MRFSRLINAAGEEAVRILTVLEPHSGHRVEVPCPAIKRSTDRFSPPFRCSSCRIRCKSSRLWTARR